MNENACPKCGSTEAIPEVRILDHGHGNHAMDLSATVYENPEAWVFKNPDSHRFKAKVCGGCGYTELYVDDPHGLLKAAKRAKPSKQSG